LENLNIKFYKNLLHAKNTLYTTPCSESSNGWYANLLINSQSDLNFFLVDRIRKIAIQGITGKTSTLGCVEIHLRLGHLDLIHTFQIVDNVFPIKAEGIIGLDLLELYDAIVDLESLTLKLNYRDTVVEVPLNSQTQI